MSERSVNKVILLGRLGRDAETKFSPAGLAVSKFSLATTTRVKGKDSGEWGEETEWHNIVLFRGEAVAPYLLKGKQVYVEGRLKTRSWEDKDTHVKKYMTEILCDELVLIGSGGGNTGEAAQAETPQPPRAAEPRRPAPPTQDDLGINDDDVPF